MEFDEQEIASNTLSSAGYSALFSMWASRRSKGEEMGDTWTLAVETR